MAHKQTQSPIPNNQVDSPATAKENKSYGTTTKAHTPHIPITKSLPQLSPGREEHEGEMEGPGASQSADCEPTPPPLQRRGSNANLFPPPGEPHHHLPPRPHHYPRLSPLSRNTRYVPKGDPFYLRDVFSNFKTPVIHGEVLDYSLPSRAGITYWQIFIFVRNWYSITFN